MRAPLPSLSPLRLGVGRRVFLGVCAALLSIAPPSRAAQSPSNPRASDEAKALLAWLSDLPERPEQRVVIGQYISRELNNTDGRSTAESWKYYYEELAEQTGHHVGLVGFDFSTRAQFQQSGSDNKPGDSTWRDYALEHVRRGGLLKLMWHAGNPWTDASSWSEIPAGHALRELITPGNPAFDRWAAWLDALADRLEAYRDLGIPVLWAPLHEASGDWFWWGQKASNEDYVAVWRHMYTYFVETRQLHHLLWAYCPSNHYAVPRTLAQYPGNAFVDIISPDKYDDTDLALYTEFTQPAYGKVFGWGEVGETDVPMDNRQFIREIREKFPRVVFYMQWADNRVRRSIRSNNHAKEVMQDPWIITRSALAQRTTVRP